MAYVPASKAEEKEAETLFDAAEQIMPAIGKALDDAKDASMKHSMALRILSEKELPPEIERPTPEAVEALRKAATTAWKDYWAIIGRQADAFDDYLHKYPKNWYARHRFAWFLADCNLRYMAADEWRAVIEQEPRFPYAYNNLASLDHMGTQHDEQAFGWLHKAIELYDGDPTFYMNLAVNYSTHRYMVIKQYGWDKPRVFREIIHCYQRARKLEPKNIEIAQSLASQYILAKHFDVANTVGAELDAWKYLLRLDLTPSQRVNTMRSIGRVMFKGNGDLDGASEWLHKALAIDEDAGCRSLLKQIEDARQGISKDAQE